MFTGHTMHSYVSMQFKYNLAIIVNNNRIFKEFGQIKRVQTNSRTIQIIVSNKIKPIMEKNERKDFLWTKNL